MSVRNIMYILMHQRVVVVLYNRIVNDRLHQLGIEKVYIGRRYILETRSRETLQESFKSPRFGIDIRCHKQSAYLFVPGKNSIRIIR